MYQKERSPSTSPRVGGGIHHPLLVGAERSRVSELCLPGPPAFSPRGILLILPGLPEMSLDARAPGRTRALRFVRPPPRVRRWARRDPRAFDHRHPRSRVSRDASADPALCPRHALTPRASCAAASARRTVGVQRHRGRVHGLAPPSPSAPRTLPPSPALRRGFSPLGGYSVCFQHGRVCCEHSRTCVWVDTHRHVCHTNSLPVAEPLGQAQWGPADSGPCPSAPAPRGALGEREA